MGEPYYSFMRETSQHIVYISDIGATSWGKPIFIATSAVMVVTFNLVFIIERWQRHKRQLAPNYRRSEKIMSAGAIFWSIIGGAGLILLTIFDTADYQKVHDSLLGVFIAGYVISAICVCVEYALLGLVVRRHQHQMGLESHKGHRLLLASFSIKLCFIVVELALAIAFGVTEYTGKYNQSAILEWIVALLYICCEYLPTSCLRRQQRKCMLIPSPRRLVVHFRLLASQLCRGKDEEQQVPIQGQVERGDGHE